MTRSLQSYLNIVDPMLFIVLKTIRRSFEIQPSLQWVITNQLASYIYSFAAGLPAVNIDIPSVDIKVQTSNVQDVEKLENVISELQRHSFTRYDKGDKIQLNYPLCSVIINIELVDDVKANWITNKKGKHTYPLAKLEKIEQKDNVWWKEVVNNVIISNNF